MLPVIRTDSIQAFTRSMIWSNSASNVNSQMWGVVYGNGIHVAVGDNGTIQTTPDIEIYWTCRNSVVNDILFGVSYGNGKYVIVGDNGTMLSSNDGISWTKRSGGTILTSSDGTV